MRFKILSIVFIFISCNHQERIMNHNCNVDFEFQSNFQNCIEIMALRELGYAVRFEYTGKAYYCLQTLTKHKSPIDVSSDTPLYYPYSEKNNYFVEDFKSWSIWYEVNKCSMDMGAADSIFKSSDVDLTWPPFLGEIILRDSSYVGY